MIDFGRFYQQIATGPLSHWLDTLPAQLSEWKSNQLHGGFKSWEKMLDNLPIMEPTHLDLKIASRHYANLSYPRVKHAA